MSLMSQVLALLGLALESASFIWTANEVFAKPPPFKEYYYGTIDKAGRSMTQRHEDEVREVKLRRRRGLVVFPLFVVGMVLQAVALFI